LKVFNELLNELKQRLFIQKKQKKLSHIIEKDTKDDILKDFNLINTVKVLRAVKPTDDQTTMTHNKIEKIEGQTQSIEKDLKALIAFTSKDPDQNTILKGIPLK